MGRDLPQDVHGQGAQGVPQDGRAPRSGAGAGGGADREREAAQAESLQDEEGRAHHRSRHPRDQRRRGPPDLHGEGVARGLEVGQAACGGARCAPGREGGEEGGAREEDGG